MQAGLRGFGPVAYETRSWAKLPRYESGEDGSQYSEAVWGHAFPRPFENALLGVELKAPALTLWHLLLTKVATGKWEMILVLPRADLTP